MTNYSAFHWSEKARKYAESVNPENLATKTELNTGLSVKANTDADNFTATAKETVVGWGMPDYTAGVSKTKNTDYEAEFDGILICYITSVVSGGARDWITVDGQVVSVSTNSWDGYKTSMFALIPKGSSFRITQNSGGTWTHTFYPLKGVV